MAGRGRNPKAKAEPRNWETAQGKKAIGGAVSLLQASVQAVNPEILRAEMIYLSQLYSAVLGLSAGQTPADARDKLLNIERQADALYRGLRDMGGLAACHYTNLVDEEQAALARDMESIQKIKTRAGRIATFLPVKKGQQTPSKALLACCWEILTRMGCHDSSLPPKICRIIHEASTGDSLEIKRHAITGEKLSTKSQLFDAAWDKYGEEIITSRKLQDLAPNPQGDIEVY